MPYKLIGRSTDFKGKSLWEIVGNLKQFGIGRMIGRNMFQRYTKPCYFKIMKVEALPDVESSFEIKRKVITLVEKIFCGTKFEKPVQLESATYKTDYFLIHKCKESQFVQNVEKPIHKIFPKEMEFPPLVKEIIIRQMKAKKLSIIEEPMMKIIYNKSGFKTHRTVNTGETPTVQDLSIGLGKPKTPKLYKNLIK